MYILVTANPNNNPNPNNVQKRNTYLTTDSHQRRMTESNAKITPAVRTQAADVRNFSDILARMTQMTQKTKLRTLTVRIGLSEMSYEEDSRLSQLSQGLCVLTNTTPP